jgi:glutamate synthase domain-containing protein 1
MKDLRQIQNPYGDDKVIEACGLFGILDTSGRRFSGAEVTEAMKLMHDRGNGLGGGFAAYGIYPEHADCYALHVMMMHPKAREEVEDFLQLHFEVVKAEPIPTRRTSGIVNPPHLHRYFVHPRMGESPGMAEDDYVVARVMEINTNIDGAFVFSSGKNMGVFKGVGYPEQISEYFCLDSYEGYLWTGHNRFPTNTPGWWGGAHPFNLLDWTVVHNGEISSYGINVRFLEMYGYRCTMQTDTEVLAYALDLLIRRHRLPVEVAARVLAPPLWTEIAAMPPAERRLHEALRQVYGSLLMNGPFTIIAAHEGEMIALGDRIRLRPLVAGICGDRLYVSSEESAIWLVCPNVEVTWIPVGGQPVIGRLGKKPTPPEMYGYAMPLTMPMKALVPVL